MLPFKCREKVIHNSRLTSLKSRFNPFAGAIVCFLGQSVQCYIDAVQLWISHFGMVMIAFE